MHLGIRFFGIITITIAFLGVYLSNTTQHKLVNTFADVAPSTPIGEPIATEVTTEGVYSINHHFDGIAHAPSIALGASGKLYATWWSGSREGGKDVNIYFSTFDSQTNAWQDRQTIATAKSTESDVSRYIRKLGNSIIAIDDSNRLHIFYVSVSVGGWAASSLNWIHSEDDGKTWSTSKRLITAPFLNLSTLVKGSPVFFDDGSIGLPVYHEFAGKLAEFLRVSREGEVLYKSRLSHRRYALQPVTHVTSPTHAYSLMRYAGDVSPYVLYSETSDSAIHWTPPSPTNIPNPDSAVALIQHPVLHAIGVFNDLSEDRYKLSLYYPESRSSWARLHRFEDKTPSQDEPITPRAFMDTISKDISHLSDKMKTELISQATKNMCKRDKCKFQFDYPYLIQGSGDEYHLVYTWNKTSIHHIHFRIATKKTTP